MRRLYPYGCVVRLPETDPLPKGCNESTSMRDGDVATANSWIIGM